MTIENSYLWICNYCGKNELQGPPRSMAMPPIPPPGWIRLQVSRHREILGSAERKKSEELQTIQRDACPACTPEVEKVVLRA